MRLYQKSGGTDFDELWDTISTLDEGTNSLVMSESELEGRFVMCRYKTSTLNSQWLVLILRIGGTDFLHHWCIDVW